MEFRTAAIGADVAIRRGMPTRFWMPLLAVSFAACSPNVAEVRCGTSACGANQRCEPKNLVCVLDEAPELIIASPQMGALVSGDTLMVEGIVRDDTGAASLELSVDDGGTWFKVPLAGTKFSAKVGLPLLDYQPMKLQLRAHDARQQATKAQLTVQVDNVAPQLSVGYPVDGAALGLAWFAGEAKVTGRAVDGSGLTSLTVDVGDGAAAIAVVGETFEWAWPAPAGEDGVAHALVVTAIDLAGNRTVVTRGVTVDVVAPTVAFTLPAEDALLGQTFFAGGGIVRGDVAGADRVFVELGNGPQSALVADGAWSAVYRPGALDFVPRVLAVSAVDAAGNTARAERGVIVDVVSPKLGFTGTLQGARLNAASFPQGDDVVADWAVSDGDAQVEVKAGNAVATNPLRIATAPTDNPKAYAVTLKAEDRAGNTAQAALSFEVDRVAPVVTYRSPQPNLRNAETVAALTFSEPMMGGAGLVLSPPVVGGVWSTPTTYKVAGLAHDSVYALDVGPATDLFGNPVAPQPATKFHTVPKWPAFDTELIPNVGKFEVALDGDGVFHFFTTSPTTPAAYRWTRVHPKTGLIEDHKPSAPPTLGVTFSQIQLFAHSRANADLSARRVAATTTLMPSVITERKGWTRFDDQTANVELGVVGIIPAPAMPEEGAGLGEVGVLKLAAGAVFYARTGKPDLATGMGPPTAMGVAPSRWEMVEVSGSLLKRRAYQCVPGVGGFPGSCGLTPLFQFNDVAAPETVSVAVGEACSLYAYDSTSGGRVVRVEPWPASCGGKACPPAWTMMFPAGSEVRVAANGGSTFAIAERTSATDVQLKKLTLDGSCQGSPVVTATLTIPAAAAFRPVVQWGGPAMVWLDGTSLKVSR